MNNNLEDIIIRCQTDQNERPLLVGGWAGLGGEVVQGVLGPGVAQPVRHGVDHHAGGRLVRGHRVLYLYSTVQYSAVQYSTAPPTDISVLGWSMKSSSASWPSRDTLTLFSPYSSSGRNGK